MKLLLITCFLFISINVHANTTEFRGIWVVTWEIFRDGKDGRFYSNEEIKKNIIKILDNIKLANLNNVMWQVRQGATSYYKSSFEPWGKHLNYKAPNFDPFLFAIDQAHERGLKIHAWINTFEARDTSLGTPAQLHPEWICRNKFNEIMPAKITLSPGMTEVKDYLKKIIFEIVNNYDLDGLHLDYIRWSEYPVGEDKSDEYVVGQYLFDLNHKYQVTPPDNFSTWGDWRRNQVTEFVKTIKKLIKRKKPAIVLSAAVIGKYNWGKWNGYYSAFQDSAKWYNENYIDLLIPMAYYEYSTDRLEKYLIKWNSFLQKKNKTKFILGIGSLVLRQRDSWDNHFSLMEVTRQTSWVNGVQFFSYDDWEIEDFFNDARDLFN